MRGQKTIEQNIFFVAKPEIFKNASVLRNNETEAEKKLWKYINQNKLLGYKFRRQHPINIFIVDFYCHKARLVIEIDGGIHKNKEIKEYDIGRTAEIENFGLTVIRFSNEEINNNIESVFNKIKEYLFKNKG